MPFLLVESQLGSLKMLGEVVVPDLAESILAYRVFRTTPHGILQSMHSSLPDINWIPGQVKEAKCCCATYVGSRSALLRHEHPPALGGWCGVHAFKDLGTLNDNYTGVGLALQYAHVDAFYYVVGQVWLWGKVIEHEFGYRAQYAEIKSIINPLWGIPLCDDKWWKFREKRMRKVVNSNSKTYKALATLYNAELVAPPEGLFHQGNYAMARTSLMRA